MTVMVLTKFTSFVWLVLRKDKQKVLHVDNLGVGNRWLEHMVPVYSFR